MPINDLNISNSDIVAGQKVFSSQALARIQEIEDWANDQVADKAMDLDSAQTATAKKTFSAGADMGSQVISHVKDPVADQDAATKKFVSDNTNGPFSPVLYEGQQSVTLPNGMIMKFGKVTNVPTGSYKTITFTDAFPNACISAIANFGERGQSAQDGNDDCGTSSVTASSIRVWSYGISSSIDCYWMALGW